MRVIYPEEIKAEAREIGQYMVYKEGRGMVVREDAPQDIPRRYAMLVARMRDIDRRHR